MIFGIDLGTTKSAIGYWQRRPTIIPDESGNLTIPSLVLVTKDGGIFTGREAQNHPDRYKGDNLTIGSVKRLLGKADRAVWGWKSSYPQEVGALILAELRYQAEKYTGKDIKDVVIAIPAHFDANQRRATKEAAELAGLKVLKLLNEATAAVLTYGFVKDSQERKKKSRIVLVFDFGGGTLDISIVEFGEGIYEVKSVIGDSRLGGIDFDRLLFDYVVDQVSKRYDARLDMDTFHKMVLEERVEQAKKDLSSVKNALILIPGFLNINSGTYDLDIAIDRQTFEDLSQSLFSRAIELTRRALVDVGLKIGDLDDVLLLGGTSRMPFVKKALAHELRNEPFVGIDPIVGVAQGAIIQAAVYDGMLRDILLLDVLSGSVGIEAQDGRFCPIIPKNSTLPTKKSHVFTTTQDNQTEIVVKVYQEEKDMAIDNICLGIFKLDIIPWPKGKPRIEVTFDAEPWGTLSISAKESGTGKEIKADLESLYSMDYQEKKKAQELIESWLAERKGDS
jgi:molecular chaperone DnaK